MNTLLAILSAIAGPIIAAIFNHFKKPPEQKVREEDAKKITDTSNRIADPDPPYVVRDGDDQWAKPKVPVDSGQGSSKGGD